MEEEAESSSAAVAVVLALVALAVVPGLVLLARSRWRRAAARREEVRRLARLAAEESELAERESVLAYYSELFPSVVHAAEVPEAPAWGAPPPVVVAPAREDVEAQPQPQLPERAKGVCAVCFRPTTFRCKQCKAVKYCSFKCQIAHWRQGHKDECHPPSLNTKPDDEGRVEHERAAEENVSVGVKLVAAANKPAAVGSETSDANHSMKSLIGEGEHMPLEDLCTSTEVPGGHKSNSMVEIPQNLPVSADGSKMASNTEYATFVEDGSSSKDLNEFLPCKSQATAPKISGRSGSPNEESFNHSNEHHKAQDANVVEDCSQTSHNRELEDRSNHRAAASVVLEPKSSRNPIRMELERSKTKPVGNDNIQSTKPVSSVLTVEKATSVRGGCSAIPMPSKMADNHSDRSFTPSERSGSTANNLATSLKKIVRQQTAPKVVRHYPSELTLFPYELFVKLFDKVELQPFGLHNLGNSCYANAVLQCLMFTRPLTTYLLEGLHSKNCSKREWCFMCEFEKLIVEGKRHRTALSPTGILSHLHDIGSSFGPGKQEDAHEFLRYAIDAMQSVCMKEARKGGALKSAEETTLVQMIFGGYLRSKIKCSRCHVTSEQCERMLDLTVEIDGDISSLDEALVRCKSYERAKKKLIIEEAPNVLTIALKRYQSGKFGKINKAIRFPETLNMVRYMNPDTDDRSPVYSLYAVVVHHDVMNAAFSGHYVCYVKDTQGKWFKADDSQVKPVSLDNVMSKCAYMLLYARCLPRAPSSVRQMMMVQDPARSKKAKQKVVPGGTPFGGRSFRRHEEGHPHTDYMADDLAHTSDEYGDAPYPPAESPSPSESSSLFSNSDSGSHSTVSTDSSDSTRNSTSTEEYEYLFGTSDQFYPGAPAEHDYPMYSRSRSCLNTSSSGRAVDDAERFAEHKLQGGGGAGGGWVEGDESPSSLYTDRSKHQSSSKLADQYRQLDRSGHDPGDTRGGVLLRRTARERTAQTFY
ncbi:Ubiquitin carboxyl-terminal hydrolase 17 [Dichanthelium oligosanthes]|uniref:ubiquitinyl hydrolase 1 n=1 Tax=Dichanthelium oligosanthes TaxID=888268 RepID=A0A1E5VFY5_9POAL|nr:Ubiquitin carboxyl-terminal hydrolase 17 [Dichanthelium oligosanthes]